MTKKALFLKYIPQFNSSNYFKLIRGSFYLYQVSDLFCGDDLTKLNFSGIRFETNKRAKILSRELSQTLYYITSEIQNSRHGFQFFSLNKLLKVVAQVSIRADERVRSPYANYPKYGPLWPDLWQATTSSKRSPRRNISRGSLREARLYLKEI